MSFARAHQFPSPTKERRKQKKINQEELQSAIDKNLSRYFLESCIGKGQYGITYKVINKRTRLPFCLKKIHDAWYCHTDAKNVFREVHAMNEIRKSPMGVRRKGKTTQKSTGIVYFHDIYMNQRDVYLVTPLKVTDLRHATVILESDNQREWICFQLAWMLRELHEGAKCIHRDLCPENILLDEKCNVMLGDLGLVRDACCRTKKELPPQDTEDDDSLANTYNIEDEDDELPTPHAQTDYCGKLWFRAPEIICGNPYYAEEVDIWSLGCIIVELWVGTLYVAKNSMEQLKNILLFTGVPERSTLDSFQSPIAQSMVEAVLQQVPQLDTKAKQFRDSVLSQLPTDIADIVEQCLQFDPKQRITAAQIMKHKLFEDLTPFDIHDRHLPAPLLKPIQFPENIDSMSIDELRARTQAIVSAQGEQSVSPTKRGFNNR